MEESPVKGRRKRRGSRTVRFFMQLVSASMLFFRDRIQRDLTTILVHFQLFLGIAFLGVGVLAFQSGKYCDGNASNYYACTRPSTFYYYPWWAIALVIIGSFSVVLWFLRKSK